MTILFAVPASVPVTEILPVDVVCPDAVELNAPLIALLESNVAFVKEAVLPVCRLNIPAIPHPLVGTVIDWVKLVALVEVFSAP
jgi:hypothetical protein